MKDVRELTYDAIEKANEEEVVHITVSLKEVHEAELKLLNDLLK